MHIMQIPDQARRILRRDPVTERLLSELDLRFAPSRGSVYADLIESIIYQQISVKAARAIAERFCAYFGGDIPTAAALAPVPAEELRALGLSWRKAEYVSNIAEFFVNENLDNSSFLEKSDQDIMHLLTRIKGVGVWTVQMILIFSLAREDVFPASDYGVQTAMEALYDLERQADGDRISTLDRIADAWRPYRTYGTLLVWAWKRQQIGFEDG